MQKVEVTRLDNGLTVVSDARPDVASVAMGVWVNVGTRQEPARLNGIAHMLEHMAFKGTERRSAFDIAREIEDVGGSLNAYTSRESTAYHAQVLAADMPLALDMLADILQHSTFVGEELERERGVILQELGQAADTPDDIIFDHFQETAFPNQPLGRPVLGRPEVIRAVTADDLRGYMQQHYHAGNMVVSAAGQLTHDDFVERVATTFDSLPQVGATEPLDNASYHGGEFRENKSLEQAHLVLGFPGLSRLDDDYYAVNLLATLLGGGMSSRLFQEVREKRGLVYSIFAFHSAYSDKGLFGIYAGTGEEETAALLPVICDQLSEVSVTLSEEEVDRARAQLRASILMGLESSASRCENQAKQLLAFGRVLTIEEIEAKLAAVNAAQIKRLAARLAGLPPTLASIGPLSKLESFDSLRSRLAA